MQLFCDSDFQALETYWGFNDDFNWARLLPFGVTLTEYSLNCRESGQNTVTCTTTIDFHYFYVISSYKTAEKTIIQTEKVDYLGNLSREFGHDLFLLLEMIFWCEYCKCQPCNFLRTQPYLSWSSAIAGLYTRQYRRLLLCRIQPSYQR